ncbi:hypothetical protein JWG45_21700 [Leptospira sp. 201903070]|uniref:Uncharacterized protein n=1 Tax=Leptospira ainlahdjerensis TaxID=2810033 RepID=A0ABS2UJL2_9LEPT|nr:hypothetical protein [Leptospira ainlahdjerensis]MBM9579767.1 hypothetical protein [Leptospira ainlahdjerensis]
MVVGIDVAKPLSHPAYTLGNADELENLKEEAETLCSKIIVFRRYLRNEKDVRTAAKGTLDAFDGIEILLITRGALTFCSQLTEDSRDLGLTST